MVEYTNAIKKPFSDIKNLLIGGIITIIPFVNLISIGNAIENGKKSNLETIKTDGIVNYIINAIMALIISIIYMIIPAIVLMIGGASMIGSMISGGGDATALASGLAAGGPIMLIGGLLYIVMAFLLPMAMGKWIKAGNLGASLKIVDVVKNALTVDYVVTLIVIMIYSMVLMIVAGIVGGILAFIPIVGIFITLIIMGCAGYAMAITSITLIVETVK